MDQHPHPSNEKDRVKVLRDYQSVEAPREELFDDLVMLASSFCDTPVSLISLIDEDYQWVKSSVGASLRKIPRANSFCAHTVLKPELLIVEDASKDPRFADNPLVTSEPYIRFYAGAPLIVQDTYALGSLCVIDSKPRSLSRAQQSALRLLSRQATRHLETRSLERTLEMSEKALLNCLPLANLGEVSNQIGHEIKNPLTVIRLLSNQLSQFLHQKSLPIPTAQEICIKISDAADRIKKIISGFERVARNGELDSLQSVDAVQVILDAVEFCRYRFQSSDVKFFLDEFPVGILINCRPIEISQVLINLINNAVDAVAHLPQRWIRVSCFEGDHFVEISVTDSGPGIPETIRDRIFSPYFTTKPIGKGSGIGLALSRKIARAHRGGLELDRESRNTRFVMKLPKGREKSSNS